MLLTNSTPFYFKCSILILVCFSLFTSASGVIAKEVQLRTGESYREGDLTVTCQDGSADAGVIQLRECQYWDDFKKTCLFEKAIFVYKGLQCVEECRHWDSFQNVCHYQTRCVFYSDQGSFVLTDCVEFDDFSNKCLKKSERIIGGSGRRGR